MEAEKGNGKESARPAIEIRAEIARRVTFASHQNDVAVVLDLAVYNGTEDAQDDLLLEITADPPVLGTRRWRIDRIPAGGEVSIDDRHTPLAGGLLHNLAERMHSEIRLSLTQGDTVLAECRHQLTALARNEWGGARHMPELLAAFVTPNDPAVSRLLKDASNILKSAGRDSAIDGYRGRSRTRVWELSSAIWAAVAGRRITYALPPASFEREGQKIRLPSDIEAQGLATCLDTTLLFAAALEQAGLKSIVAFTEGHALVGVWLQPQNLVSMTVDDAMELRKAVDLNELVLFETTLATQTIPLPFTRAIDRGQEHIAEARETAFIYAIDIDRARGRGVQPLSFRAGNEEDRTPNADQATELPPLDAPPPLPAFDTDIVAAETDEAATPAERLERWKRSLLDLSKRNRLLNLRETRTAISIICPAPALLEDRIADGKRIKLIPPPESKGADAEIDSTLRKLRTGDDLDVQFAREALSRNEIVANMDAKSLEKGTIDLYRKARADLQEGGTNTLFLALGMLRWRPTGEAVRSYRAPLILLPVKLERRSARSKPYLTSHEDDPVFNLTLLEMLRQDFDIHLSELSGELPTDNSGIDVSQVWDIVRKRIRDVPGFEVVEDVVLSTFSFAKYLMWKDLADRTEDLKRSPFVRHMIDNPRDPYDGGATLLAPREIDDRIDPGDLLAPLNADSSQIVAIRASADGGDFVLEGPPGTGKSETIGNIIAHNIGQGRRVLFVSEKMAALEVVYERLKKHGLGDFCLELHSAKANKRAVVQQLGAAWDERSRKSKIEWDETAAQLKDVRSSLNGLVKALHEPGPAGVSPREAIGRLLRYDQVHPLDLGWPADLAAGHAPSPESYAALRESAHSLKVHFEGLEPEDFEVFDGIAYRDWSNAWQSQAAARADELHKAIKAFKAARDKFTERLGLRMAGDSVAEARALAVLAGLAGDAFGRDCRFAFSADAKRTIVAVDEASAELVAYREIQTRLIASYADDRIALQPIENFRREYGESKEKSWPFNILARRKLRKAIRTHFGLSARDARAPEVDLAKLHAMAERRAAMNKRMADIHAGAPWQELETDVKATHTTLRAGEKLRAAANRLSGFGGDPVHIRTVLSYWFGERRDMLEPGMPLREACDALAATEGKFQACLQRFADLAAFVPESPNLGDLADITGAITARQRRLKSWCAWIEARTEAEALGLGALASVLRSGVVAPGQAVDAFETAYCRWAAPLLIDSREDLKRFSSARHEDLIAKFRRLDEHLAALSATQIRARLSGDVPRKADAAGAPGYGVLARELQKKMRHLPVRRLVSELGPALTALTPCLMMSPLSVAQFLPHDQAVFDLVVFDEASQITVPDAIGAIARGKNCVIVGDPKQMPPTRFFERGADEGDENDLRDLESILDEALAARTPLHRLTGHYRSRHESLICFSNHTYYGGELVTFPAANTRVTAVMFRKVDGVYARAKARTNEIEAKAVVDEVVDRLRDPSRSGLSIGVVTLNSEQQRLVEDLLDRERRADPDLERFFGEETGEPVFVKNLETVQGDQRDVILISIGYGPTEPGGRTMSMNFGPLNRDGGERRLNVAITRATTEVIVFASFDSGMIDLQRSSAAAVRDLKHYLDFAERGPVALSEAIHADGGLHAYDSDFEEAVANGLRRRGWSVLTQIGVSKFRIDLGLVHPDAPGRFMAGIECDGAAYHASPSARDRDRLRQIILERLGWRLLRVWSTDFFNDPESALDRLHKGLEELLETDRAEAARRSEETDTGSAENPAAPDPEPKIEAEPSSGETAAPSPPGGVSEPATIKEPPDQPRQFRLWEGKAELPPADAERFYEPDYLPTVRAMSAAIIDSEGPITFKRLSQLIAREHGFQRTGKEIRGTVWRACQKVRRYNQAPDQHKVFWPQDMPPKPVIAFRGLSFNHAERAWPDIPFPEKLGLVSEVLKAGPADTARAVAEQIGYTRITSRFREEVDRLVSALREDR